LPPPPTKETLISVNFVAVVEGRRQRSRPKLRWEDGVTVDARKLGGGGEENGGMLQGIGTVGIRF